MRKALPSGAVGYQVHRSSPRRLQPSGGERHKRTPDGFVNAIQERAPQLFRYGATSLLALTISECTLLILVAMNTNATIAALAANAAGIVPSYLLSRYWIWPDIRQQRALNYLEYLRGASRKFQES